MRLGHIFLVCFVLAVSAVPVPDETAEAEPQSVPESVPVEEQPVEQAQQPAEQPNAGVPAVENVGYAQSWAGQGMSQAGPVGPSYTEVGNANAFVDMLLEKVKTNPEVRLDPFAIPERGLGFNRSVMGIPFSGAMKIHSGVVTGLSTLHRTGDCSMLYDKDVMHIDARLGMGLVKARATGSVKFQNLGPSVEYTAEIGFADIDMSLAVDVATMKATLTKFQLKTLKGLRATISGLGPLNYLFNFFSVLNTTLFKNTFRFITEQIMSAIVKSQLKNMTLML